jgi:dolichol-phosphate mannosyltransferase
MQQSEQSVQGQLSRRVVSFIIPVFNEEPNIMPLHQALMDVLAPLSSLYEFEFIFTDNHSSDGTFEKLEELAAHDDRIRVLRFSKNFGYQKSIFTGYLAAKGDAAIQLDCDMQDPPRLIPDFIREWENGYQVVYGVRCSRKEGRGINFLRQLFYRLINRLSEEPLPIDAGDFRLVDRIVLEEIKKMNDATPYLRGSIAQLGFNQKGIEYDRAERKYGVSKFSFSGYMDLSIDGILNHSVLPLRFATYVGLLISLLTFCALIAYFIGKIIMGKQWPAGFATTTTLILLSLSLNALFLGIIGEYLGRIYKQVKKGPLTVIEKKINA